MPEPSACRNAPNSHTYVPGTYRVPTDVSLLLKSTFRAKRPASACISTQQHAAEHRPPSRPAARTQQCAAEHQPPSCAHARTHAPSVSQLQRTPPRIANGSHPNCVCLWSLCRVLLHSSCVLVLDGYRIYNIYITLNIRHPFGRSNLVFSITWEVHTPGDASMKKSRRLNLSKAAVVVVHAPRIFETIGCSLSDNHPRRGAILSPVLHCTVR